MSGEVIVVYGTPKTLEASGAAISNNNVAQADDASYSKSSDGANFPHVRIRAKLTFGTAPLENSTVIALSRSLDIGGSGLHAEAPENSTATFKGPALAAFQINNVTTDQYVEAFAYDVPDKFNVYLWNAATGQTLSAGWTVEVTPMSEVIAP